MEQHIEDIKKVNLEFYKQEISFKNSSEMKSFSKKKKKTKAGVFPYF